MELMLIIALGAVIAGFIQGVSGFAFGMVSMSIWVWVIDPQIAAPLVVFGALSGQVMAAFKVKEGFSLQVLLPYIAGGLLGVPLGTVLLPQVDIHLFKLFFGIFLMIWCPVMLFFKNLPRIQQQHFAVNGIIGVLGGIMSGFGGFSGVLPTLWCTLCSYNRDTQRSIVQNFSLCMLAVTMVSYIATGLVTVSVLPLFAVVLPSMLIPTWLGMKAYSRVNQVFFRQLTLVLLTLSGTSMLVAALTNL